MSKRVSLLDRDATGITDGAAAKTAGVVETLIAPANQVIEQINVDQLFAHPDNPRGQVGEVDDLAASIKANGLLEPLIVCHAEAWQASDDRLPYLTAIDYVIIAGHRRKTAAVQAGVRDVPCIVRDDLVGANAEVAMLVENLQREDLTALQEAQGFHRLEEQGKSQREIARLVGCNQSHVSKRLGLLKLPEHVQARVAKKGADGKPAPDAIDVADAVALTKLADAPPSVINGVLKRPSWKSLDDAIDEAVETRERDKAKQVKIEQLRASGITNVVAYPQYGFYRGDKPPTPLDYLADDGVDISEHEHFACHAVAVGYSYNNTDLRVVPVCTKPSAHGDSKAAKAADNAAKEKQRREREEARRAKARAERTRIIGGLASKPSAAVDEIVNAAIIDMLLEQHYDVEPLAELLGIDVSGHEQWKKDEPIRAFAAASKANARRLVATATLLLVDDGDVAGRGDLLTLLGEHGYKLSADEKATVKRSAAPAAAVEVPQAAYPQVDAEGFIKCPECEHGQPDEGCDCDCACNPANVDEADDDLVEAEAVSA